MWPGGQAMYKVGGGGWTNIAGNDDDFQTYLELD
jgi:hypothetical protein